MERLGSGILGYLDFSLMMSLIILRFLMMLVACHTTGLKLNTKEWTEVNLYNRGYLLNHKDNKINQKTNKSIVKVQNKDAHKC